MRTMPPAPPPVIDGVQLGVASWYGPGFHGNRTANGEIYDQYELTAAHRTLPLGTRVMVTNLSNGRAVEVRINDRGPFVGGRAIDLSYAAASGVCVALLTFYARHLLGGWRPGTLFTTRFTISMKRAAESSASWRWFIGVVPA